MAVTFANDTTIRTSTLLSDLPENILLDPVLNGRYDRNTPEVKAAVEALAASIKTEGQNTAAKVRKNEDGLPVLVFGYCRWHAVKLINAEQRKQGVEEDQLTRLEFDYEKLTEEKALIRAIQENHLRVGVTPMDHCYNIQLLRKQKLSEEAIATVYFPNFKRGEKKDLALKFVRDHGALEELVPEAVAAVNNGEIKVTAAVQLAKVAPVQQKKLVEESMVTVKGKKRLPVAAVLAAKTGKTAEKAKAAVEASKAKKSGTPAPAPAKPAVPAVKPPTTTVYEAAETLARAVDAWLKNEPKADKGIITAHSQYRALVPLKQAEGRAAA